ncbi:hypothetical protein SASPL_158148 [Salvia splendens]|uniref:MAR-binding filament-like protein 1-1 n=1 Tax=Salvia splendens TaxID=180675 RepID=A0A8X8VTR9_SALSN|nr:hypothetical protein SASPL_158148 [Salvia splendens]
MVSLLPYSIFSKPLSPILPRNAPSRRKKTAAVACLQQQNPKDEKLAPSQSDSLHGFRCNPLLTLRADSVQGLPAAVESESRKVDQNLEEESGQKKASSSPFLSLLNALGFLGSGVLAALYASLQKEKAAADANIESLNVKLKEKAAAIASSGEDIRWDVANGTISGLGKDLQREKKLVEVKRYEAERLEASLREAGNEKRELQDQLKEKLDSLVVLEERINLVSSEVKEKEVNLTNVNSKFIEKEGELEQLSSVYKQAQDQISSLNSEIQNLKDEIVEKEKELELKNTALDGLNDDLSSSRAELDESRKKLDGLLKEYNEFKSSSEKKAALEAELLSEKEEALQQLEGKLKVALDDNLEEELKIVQETLEISRDEASGLEKQLNESRALNKLQTVSNELASAVQKCDSLNKELAAANEKAETAVSNLKEEKNVVSSLKMELKELERQASEENEHGKHHLLSRDLELSNSRVSSLENEKDALVKSLDEQRQVSQEARENMEDAQNLVARLGKERENLESRGKKLEEELASAKGEILRLRNEISVSKTRVMIKNS